MDQLSKTLWFAGLAVSHNNVGGGMVAAVTPECSYGYWKPYWIRTIVGVSYKCRVISCWNIE
jgi:hypothetical protein